MCVEAEVKNWITDHRNNGICISTKVIVFEARRFVVTHGITDFAGTPSSCCIIMRNKTVKHETAMENKKSKSWIIIMIVIVVVVMNISGIS
jgi:fumarate reductase subunit C